MIGGALLFGAALYIGVPLTNDAPVAVERYATREEIPGGEQDDRWKTTWLLLRLVPATDGPVRLGDPSAPPGSWRECRDVELTQAFYLGVYEITARQWRLVTGKPVNNPFDQSGAAGRRAATGVSYALCRGYLAEGISWPRTGHTVSGDSFLGRLRRLTGGEMAFDLPTEAQWEYAWRRCLARRPRRVGRYRKISISIDSAVMRSTAAWSCVTDSAPCRRPAAVRSWGLRSSARTGPTPGGFTTCMAMCANIAWTGSADRSPTPCAARIPPVRRHAQRRIGRPARCAAAAGGTICSAVPAPARPMRAISAICVPRRFRRLRPGCAWLVRRRIEPPAVSPRLKGWRDVGVSLIAKESIQI